MISITAATKWEKLSLEVTAPYNGYAYVYLTNESNYNVYFDDFLVVHEKITKSLNVTESADYYPYGLLIEGTHYGDESRLVNSYGFQGVFSEFDQRTGWNRFALRGNYDSRLGRWQSGDPYQQFSSPFVGMGSNPINSIDPDGGMSSTLAWTLGGMVAGGITGGLLDDENRWRGAAIGMVAGAAAGYGLGNVNWSSISLPDMQLPNFSFHRPKPIPTNLTQTLLERFISPQSLPARGLSVWQWDSAAYLWFIKAFIDLRFDASPKDVVL